MTDHDGGPQDGDRHPRLAEQPLDLAARAEVGRELLVVGPEATEVDDLAHPGGGGHAAESPRRGGIALLEVSTVEGVHEVVGEVDALERRRQGVGVVDIRSHGGAGSVVRLGAAGERPDLES